MKFCSKCGSFLIMNHANGCYICKKCGHEEPLDEDINISRAYNNRDKVIVIGEKEQKLSTMPKTKITCSKCGNDQAYWWMVQTRGVDESSTQFYRCVKCGQTWREYS